ncbi:molybdate transport system substrate-binding protein [Promicromonospora umidemergens]|uniref:molybdate ABC transporter substrate-binding protein n=1 Tax=Promicromonospora umidemergens TaxID=629679 RepID=UPI0020A3D0E0|nr:molybdate ABC transporter substrate-binding protein [Promicromonospora umidemergens]MCP2283753.1 molybdate transport system substrate-binding protein [Promicromonospora umidemergens]
MPRLAKLPAGAPRRALAPGAAALVIGLVLTGCASTSDGEKLTVLAAASLREPFAALATTFEEAHPGVDVTMSFGGSSGLADQVEAGAPADVVATADELTMARLSDAGLVTTPTVFATNVLTIVVPTGNPSGVESLADLGRRDVDVVLCAPEVPCGRAAAAVADGAGVTPHTVSAEPSVTDVLAKVALGEADAGLVYVTDAATEPDDVETVPTPEAADVVNRYPLAVLADPPAPDLAADWVALVTGEEGRSALSEAGFGTP